MGSKRHAAGLDEDLVKVLSKKCMSYRYCKPLHCVFESHLGVSLSKLHKKT